MTDVRVTRNVPHRTARPQLGIPRPEDDAPDVGLQRRARAHGAGFQSHHQSTASQIPSVQRPRGIPQCLDLRVGKRIAQLLAPVASDSHHCAIGSDDHGPHRNLTRRSGFIGQGKRPVHDLDHRSPPHRLPFITPHTRTHTLMRSHTHSYPTYHTSPDGGKPDTPRVTRTHSTAFARIAGT